MRNVMHQLRQYKKDTFLCIGLTALEAVSYTHLDVYKRQIPTFAA